MCLIEGVSATEVDRGADDLIAQFDGPGVSVGEFGQESVSKVRIGDEELIAFEFFGEQSVAHECGPERIGIGEAHRVLSDQLFFLELSDVSSEGQERVGRELVERIVGLDGFHVFHSHAHVTADSDHLDLVSFVDMFEDLVDDTTNLGFEDSALFGV